MGTKSEQYCKRFRRTSSTFLSILMPPRELWQMVARNREASTDYGERRYPDIRVPAAGVNWLLGRRGQGRAPPRRRSRK
jgi:hypothetical protein